MTLCTCDHPSPFGIHKNICGRCWDPIAPVEQPAATPFEGAAPGTPAGEGALSPVGSSPWDVDPIEAEAFVPAWAETEGGRIKAAFEKRTGR
jgi:hypothetical protein